ncbi:Amastin surface glycoprotein, putative [Trypanosoma equiperdum]|uniref:Amastin n=2 Tax=Trypanozoon TaxID=39700 RepID=Q585J8_TRYB2|nr:hypothetical protein, conserved [Trypanosoma brucei brucei TREU927]AAX79207.1 hypothetical protein, conserved [Trypanosoma brucei]AAZ10943.1 hypothetical protein, conserved [Trypanosoma brucei brucei TREU927]SCU65817.1 Amastin surface glycoprotein, putative [Trypanosoma equiperdum]
MLCCGCLTILMTLLGASTSVCTIIFPVFRMKNETKEAIQTLWYYMEKTASTESKTSVRESECYEYSVYFQVSMGAVAAAAAVGLISLLFLCGVVACGKKMKHLKAVSLSLVFFSLLGAITCIGLVTLGYLRGYCQGDPKLRDKYAPFKERGFKIDVGSYLLCAAVALYLLTTITHCCL